MIFELTLIVLRDKFKFTQKCYNASGLIQVCLLYLKSGGIYERMQI